MSSSIEDRGLPEGWTLTSMGAVATVIGGGTPKASVPGNFSTENGHPWLTPADLAAHPSKTVSRGKRFLTDRGLANSAAKYMPAGTILFSSRAPIGYVAIAANAITTNQGFRSFVPSSALDPTYGYHYLKSISGLAEQLASGTTFSELSGSKAKTLPLPLPPLNEQRRIAARLDEVDFYRSTISLRLQEAHINLQHLRREVLSSACSGRLTADWREKWSPSSVADLGSALRDRRRAKEKNFVEPQLNPHASRKELPEGWSVIPLGLVLEDLRYGTSKRSTYDQPGVPVLRIPNVSAGVLDLSDLKFADLNDREMEALRLQSEDLLMIRSNGSVHLVGVTTAVTAAGEDMAYAGYLMRLRVDRRFLEPEFLRLILGSPQLRRQIELPARSTSGVHNINKQEVRALGVPVPAREEQHEIVRRAANALEIVDRLDMKIDDLGETLSRIYEASLDKAFRGELVPTEAELAKEERRDFEPAEDLVARVLGKRSGSATARASRTT